MKEQEIDKKLKDFEYIFNDYYKKEKELNNFINLIKENYQDIFKVNLNKNKTKINNQNIIELLNCLNNHNFLEVKNRILNSFDNFELMFQTLKQKITIYKLQEKTDQFSFEVNNDIKKELEKTLKSLEAKQSLNLEGKPLDQQKIDLLVFIYFYIFKYMFNKLKINELQGYKIEKEQDLNNFEVILLNIKKMDFKDNANSEPVVFITSKSSSDKITNIFEPRWEWQGVNMFSRWFASLNLLDNFINCGLYFKEIIKEKQQKNDIIYYNYVINKRGENEPRDRN